MKYLPRRLADGTNGVGKTASIFRLHASEKRLLSWLMKLALAALVYLMMALILGAGILLFVAGKPWLLIIAFILFVVAFGKIGCMTH